MHDKDKIRYKTHEKVKTESNKEMKARRKKAFDKFKNYYNAKETNTNTRETVNGAREIHLRHLVT